MSSDECGSGGGRRRAAGSKRKTRTPHSDVGKKHSKFARNQHPPNAIGINMPTMEIPTLPPYPTSPASHPPAAPPHRSHVVGVMGLQWHAAATAADHVLQGFACLCHDILGQGQQADGEEDGDGDGDG